MVNKLNKSGQLYTIEGIAAGILMLTTAYIVMNTTSLYTPAETHISDMQLAQLGSDVLTVMDTPIEPLPLSNLSTYIETNDTAGFSQRFRYLLTTNQSEQINFKSKVYYRNSSSNSIQSFDFNDPSYNPIITNRERMVQISRLVYLDPVSGYDSSVEIDRDRPQSVLLEVLVWRD